MNSYCRVPKWILCLLLLFCLAPAVALSHARLLPSGSTPPRNGSAGLKTGPCGDVPPTDTPTELLAGDELVIHWEEVVNHPGRFEFYFSEGQDMNFRLLTTVEDTENGTDNLPHRYSTRIQVPDTPCDACTLQMIQVMTENPASPINYYSCADIKILPANSENTPKPPQPPTSDDTGSSSTENCH